MADDKHRGWTGARVSMATTAAADGILGASVATSASPVDVEKASGVFAREAQAVDVPYAPETVNTDGGQATQNAWKALCTQSTVMLGLLHALRKIRDRAKQAVGELGKTDTDASGKRTVPPATARLLSACGASAHGLATSCQHPT